MGRHIKAYMKAVVPDLLSSLGDGKSQVRAHATRSTTIPAAPPLSSRHSRFTAALHRRASPPRFTAALALPNAPLAPHATPPSASSFTSLISSTATGSGCSHGCFGGMGGRGVV